jgi:hypothetical protein
MLVNPFPIIKNVWSGGVYFPVTYAPTGTFTGCDLELQTVTTYFDGDIPVLTLNLNRDYAMLGSNFEGTVMVTVTAGSDEIGGPGSKNSCTFPADVVGVISH